MTGADDRRGATPVFHQFNLVVGEMERSVAFYETLGLVFVDTDPPWRAHHRSAVMAGGADLDLDSVEFASNWNRGWRSGSGGGMGVLGFELASRDKVDAVYDDLVAAGHPGQQPPYDAFWGARYAVVEDPDGNAVGLMSPVDPARRTMPSLP